MKAVIKRIPPVKLNEERLMKFAFQARAERALVNVVRTLEKGGVRSVVLKGPHLGNVYYADTLERTYCDLDLLVKKRDFKKAVALLERGQYKKFEFSKESFYRDIYSSHHWKYATPEGIFLELHRDLAPGGRYKPDLDGLVDRALPFRIGGHKLLGLAPVDLLLHLCIHATAAYFRIGDKYLTDVSHMLERCPNFDWSAFTAAALSADVKGGCFYFLQAVASQRGTAVPDWVLVELAPLGVRRRLLDRYFNPANFPIHRHRDKGSWQIRLMIALLLIDDPLRWPGRLTHYGSIRLCDSVHNILSEGDR